jgi:uncharacterized membrane protein YdjX (TVP38/TMEM64 family)
MEFAAAIRMTTTGSSTQLRVVGPIVLRGSGVTCQFASNGGWRSFERAGNGPHTDTPLSHAGNRNAVFRLELLVNRLFLHVHTLQDRVLHFIFEAALRLTLFRVCSRFETVCSGIVGMQHGDVFSSNLYGSDPLTPMTSLTILFVVVFALNVVPTFAPPTWMAMSVFGFKYPDANPWIVAVVAAAAATGGRSVLAHLARRIVHSRWVAQKMRDNLAVVAEAIQRRRSVSFVAFLCYAFSPLPSNALFLAYGLSTAPLHMLAVPFFLGRVVSYAIAVIGGSAVSRHFDFEASWASTWIYFVLSQLAMLAVVYAFTRIDWRKTSEERRVRWLS